MSTIITDKLVTIPTGCTEPSWGRDDGQRPRGPAENGWVIPLQFGASSQRHPRMGRSKPLSLVAATEFHRRRGIVPQVGGSRGRHGHVQRGPPARVPSRGRRSRTRGHRPSSLRVLTPLKVVPARGLPVLSMWRTSGVFEKRMSTREALEAASLAPAASRPSTNGSPARRRRHRRRHRQYSRRKAWTHSY